MTGLAAPYLRGGIHARCAKIPVVPNKYKEHAGAGDEFFNDVTSQAPIVSDS